MNEHSQTQLEPGSTIVRRTRTGVREAFTLNLRAGEFVEVTAEQAGLDVALELHAPDDALLVAVDSPTGWREEERLLWIADTAGRYRLDVEVLDAEAGREDASYRLSVSAPRPAAATDRLRVAGATAFADGESSRRSRRYEEAIGHYRRAEGAWFEAEDATGVALALYRIGWMEGRRGRAEEALDPLRQAMERFEALGDRAKRAAAANRIGRILHLRGETEQARALFEESLADYTALGMPELEGDTLLNLGSAHRWTGKTTEALELFGRAGGIFEELGPSFAEDQAGIWLELGDLYSVLNQPVQAADCLDRALALVESHGIENLKPLCRHRRGELKYRSGDFEGALREYDSALPLRRAAQDRRGEAITLSARGTAALALSDLSAARSDFEAAAEIFVELRDPYGRAMLHHKIGRLARAEGDQAGALEAHTAAVPLFTEAGLRPHANGARFGAARALHALGDHERARKTLEEILDSTETIRRDTDSLDLRASYYATRRHYWQLYIDVLMASHREDPAAGFDRLAFLATEGWRARSLLERLQDVESAARENAEAELVDAERQLQADLNQVEWNRLRALERGAGAKTLERLESQRSRLLRDLDRSRSAIRQAGRRETALDPSSLPGLKDLQTQLLNDGTVLLAYFLGEEVSYAWKVTRRAVTAHRLPGRTEVEALASQLHGALQQVGERARASQGRLLEEFAEAVLPPDLLEGDVGRVVVLADGALHYVPFGLLPLAKDGPPLLHRAEVVTAPSASVLLSLRYRKAKRERAAGIVAVVANPDYEYLEGYRADDPDTAPLQTRPRRRAGCCHCETSPS